MNKIFKYLFICNHEDDTLEGFYDKRFWIIASVVWVILCNPILTTNPSLFLFIVGLIVSGALFLKGAKIYVFVGFGLSFLIPSFLASLLMGFVLCLVNATYIVLRNKKMYVRG